MGCKTIKLIVALILTLTTIASFIGVWRTHFLSGSMMFGTPDGSLALLVFIVSLTMWFKVVKKLCPCNKMGMGMCSKCGDMPCSCPIKK